MKRFKIVFASIFFVAILIFSSCSRKMGYGVLLWDYPEANLQDGEIVPVFIRSNISQVYVIEIPGTKERREIPLWQITEPQSRSKTLRDAERYAAYRHQYASSKTDGLPIRAESSNVARSVYRLRQNEIIKILYEGNGQPVMAGEGVQLEGKWLYVLTADGTRGWCFSHNLTQFETDASGKPIGGESIIVQTEEEDEVWEKVILRMWYPDTFGTLIKDETIDLSVINSSYGFFIDTENNKVSLNLSDLHESWEYKGITKVADSYQLNGIPVSIFVRSDYYIVVRYTVGGGRPQDFDFVILNTPLDEIIAAEKERRAERYFQLCEQSEQYTSSNYGTIEFYSDGTFSWRGYNLLVPSLISSRAGTSGIVSLNYLVSKQLSQDYDGVLTFRFANVDSELNFLYSLEENGLRLEDATGATMRGQIVTRRSASPLVLFFQKY